VEALDAIALGLLAGLFLLGTYRFIRTGVMLYADVPLSFYFLAALVIMGVYDSAERNSLGLLALAGFAAACAAWTKNEGLLFLLCVLASRPVVCWMNNRSRDIFREIPSCLVGAAPVLMVIVIFKFTISMENDLVKGQSRDTIWLRLFDASRVVLIIRGFLVELWQMGTISLFVAGLSLIFLGSSPTRPRRTITGLVSVLLLMLAGYFLAYLSTPYNLAIYINHSMDRVLIQLLPSVLLLLFLYLDDPVAESLRRGQRGPY